MGKVAGVWRPRQSPATKQEKRNERNTRFYFKKSTVRKF